MTSCNSIGLVYIAIFVWVGCSIRILLNCNLRFQQIFMKCAPFLSSNWLMHSRRRDTVRNFNNVDQDAFGRLLSRQSPRLGRGDRIFDRLLLAVRSPQSYRRPLHGWGNVYCASADVAANGRGCFVLASLTALISGA